MTMPRPRLSHLLLAPLLIQSLATDTPTRTDNTSQRRKKRRRITTTKTTTTLKESCRRNPTWRGSSDSTNSPDTTDINIDPASCSAALDWQPNSEHWAGPDRNFWDDDYLSEEMEEKMHACVAEALREDAILLKDAPGFRDEVLREPVAKEIHENNEGPIIVNLEHAFSNAEVRALEALSTCVAENFEDRHEYRQFEEASGGNTVTFLSTFIQMFAPGLAQRVIEVALAAKQSAGWDFGWDESSDDPEEEFHENILPFAQDVSDPKSLGIRTSEFLHYTGGGTLGKHSDSGSVYTVLIALSDPSDYEGGEFFITGYDEDDEEDDDDEEEEENWKLFKPDRLSALVFLSHMEHGVKGITKGTRQMFATELWRYPDCSFEMMRPSLEDWEDNYFEKMDEIENSRDTGEHGWEGDIGEEF